MDSAYDFKIASADGEDPDILDDCKGKVTLVFNIAAGCGNYPQMIALKALDEHYKDEDDFQIKAIVVDDFTCHGYGEFNDGLEAFAENEKTGEYKGLDAGQIAEKYAKNNYGVDFQFSELTKGRFDKHVYDPKWRPGAQYEQEMDPFWQHMVDCTDLPRDENNLPHHKEASPWSDPPQTVDDSKPGFSGLQGNFEKFLVSRDGKSFTRYANGFLLGERDSRGTLFPWFVSGQAEEVVIPPDSYQEDGQMLPEVCDALGLDRFGNSVYPNALQRRGITESLAILCAHIDDLLGEPTKGSGSPEKQWTLPTQSVQADHVEYGDKFQAGKGVQQTT